MAVRRTINYLNKDFSDYRSQLIDFSQTYFPNTYTDFSETSPGMMFMEQASYVGDVLSFYIDNQVQENFVQFARQTSNLYDLSYMYGYKPKVTGLSSVKLDFYQLIPSMPSSSGADTLYVPNYDYALFIGGNTTSQTEEGKSFVIEDAIDFTVSNSLDPTEVTIAQTTAGEPDYFLLKKSRNALSGEIKSVNFPFTTPTEFPTVVISDTNIGGIIDCFDTDGFQWYEVDYLGQEQVFTNLKNTNVNDPNNFSESDDSPYLLQTKQVQRRFNTRFLSSTQLQLQFGSGNPADTDEDIVPNPMNVGLGLPFERDKLTTAFSPTNFIFTNTYGIAPSNTTLTVRYLRGGGISSNVAANTITQLNTNLSKFLKQTLAANTAQYVFDSLQVNNPSAASGGMDGDNAEELRQNSISQISSQLRNVTADDYLVRALSMPPKFGIISKAITQKPTAQQSQSTLCLYVLSQDFNGNLTTASNALKQNLKSYINQYRMIGDSIDIKDAFVINIGVNFEIITLPNFNNNQVITNCIEKIKTFFNINNWQINQPIILRDISNLLNSVDGVQTINNITINNKAGTSSGYSQYAYDVAGALQNGTIFPSIDPMIFEVKYPNDDIIGRVVSIGQGGGNTSNGGGRNY
tara:strand:- start:11164 stop:13059 length:1896 start_codon:yes stop_codon:yes gene_type:complete